MFTKPSLDIPKDDTKLQLSSTTNPKVTGIFDTLKAPNFSALSLALKTSNISDLINKAGPLTLLAPSNEAFNKLSVQTLSDLQKSENLGQLQALLKGHFFKGNLDLSSLKDGQTLTNLNEEKLTVKVEGDKLFIGDVEVEKTLDASSSDVKAYSIPTLLTFEKSGESTQPTNPSESTPPVETAPVSKYIQGSMLEKLNTSGNFGTLLAAIEAADLTATLEGTGPFTIFAPNDNAFKASGTTVAELLKPENKANLQTFLKNHVVSGKNTFADFQARKFLTTLGGESIVIETNPSNVGQVVTSKNTVTAPTPDIDTNNAVIHELTRSTLF
jgi:transforming growth factor-beta-induced protein